MNGSMSDERLAEIRIRAASNVIDVGDPYETILGLASERDDLLAEIDRIKGVRR